MQLPSTIIPHFIPTHICGPTLICPYGWVRLLHFSGPWGIGLGLPLALFLFRYHYHASVPVSLPLLIPDSQRDGTPPWPVEWWVARQPSPAHYPPFLPPTPLHPTIPEPLLHPPTPLHQTCQGVNPGHPSLCLGLWDWYKEEETTSLS